VVLVKTSKADSGWSVSIVFSNKGRYNIIFSSWDIVYERPNLLVPFAMKPVKIKFKGGAVCTQVSGKPSQKLSQVKDETNKQGNWYISEPDRQR
jgi:hypothetical protein